MNLPSEFTTRVVRGKTKYFYVDRPLVSVTEALGVIHKESLERWKRDGEADAIRHAANQLYKETHESGHPLSPINHRISLEKRIADVRREWRKEATAAERGTDVHTHIAHHLRLMINATNGAALPVIDERQQAQVDRARKWVTDNRFIPLWVEQPVFHGRLLYAGTPDVVGSIDGSRMIVDWKTGAALWHSYRLQQIAYMDAYHEMTGEQPQQGLVVRLDADPEAPDEIDVVPYDMDLLDVFIGCLRVWKWSNKS